MTARPNFTVSGTKATGDVPTVQVDGSVAWAAPSGGSSSALGKASLVLYTDAPVDVHAAGQHDISWPLAYDDPYDLNALSVPPADLGLDVTFGVSSPLFTVTEAGVWSMAFTAQGNPDTDFLASLSLPVSLAGVVWEPRASDNYVASIFGIGWLPAGAIFALTIFTNAPASVDPFPATCTGLITRLR